MMEEELSQFEIPGKSLNKSLVDEFHSQTSGIHNQWGQGQARSISSRALSVPHSSTSSRNRSSKDSENENVFSFNKSPEGSDLEVLFNIHFEIDRLGDQVLDEGRKANHINL